MKQTNSILLALMLAFSLNGCGQDQPEPDAVATEEPSAVATSAAKGIDWYEGTVDEAFAEAKVSGKPIYLYWGAVWCPPCHAIAATVFKSPEFIERSKLFVPVYLDGDNENAQAYGEEFGVRGYPTMIVFDSDGVELTRIPGGIDLEAYASVLDLTLGNTSSVSNLVADIMAGEEQLAADDCTLLAYYSWGQDTRILVDLDAADVFHRMYSACPTEQGIERSVLYMSWLDAALTASQDEENPVPLTSEQRAEALQKVGSLLASDAAIKANIFTVLFKGADLTNALTDDGSEERASLTLSFLETYDRLAVDESVYARERIYTLVGKIAFERADDPEAVISEALQQEIRDMVVWADESTPSVYERQPIINALGNVLVEAGMDTDAKALLFAELDRSKQPYYYMVTLADIEQREENYDVAIEWLQKAHDVSRGPATRFQWGYYYLAGLLEMAPTDTQRIHDTTVGLISELQQGSGFYQRPKAQLDRLEGRLETWAEEGEYQSTLGEIRESVLSVCAGDEPGSDSRQTCEAFLDAA
jgi:thiol-disulfide isomerase/thioredoxin